MPGRHPVRLTVDGGAGNDRLDVTARSGTVRSGAGDDRILAVAGTEGDVGPLELDGGDGADELITQGAIRRLTASGGAGNDYLDIDTGTVTTISCGPGIDRLLMHSHHLAHKVDTTCPPVVLVRRPKSVWRVASGRITIDFAGRVTRPSTIRAVLKRSAKGFLRQTVATGTARVRPGALRVSLKLTRTGAALFRREPRMSASLLLTLKPKTGDAEVGLARFAGRLR